MNIEQAVQEFVPQLDPTNSGHCYVGGAEVDLEWVQSDKWCGDCPNRVVHEFHE